ncbi:DUF4296 domain-containing protein [uncultured Algibacter sp.]|uniref:DUF4296 domain-containing protein n=1 Tax=uncultured Algibacter sp. TaxID=298659 RepID=UPI002619D6AA|nr:DUF4296 domain-containing protein [uncultured Algibacter sp.]
MILKRFILCVGIFFIAVACNKLKGPKKPKNLISKDKMVNILIDAKLITSANSKNKTIMRDSGLDMNTYVYKKYNIDSLQFALSNDYYSFYIEDYEEIYTKLADSLVALKEELKTIEAAEWKEKTKREADSLANLLIENKENEENKDSLLVKETNTIDTLQKGDKLYEESIKELEGLLEPISDSVSQ